ncbi:hypothetical protein QBC43DRAFT_40200 [Cladorrhinum sp. PSN259]|nr:hypothetical protein QBC43DRAFT_40200 [Cladorrhinum sp. PSN259]
MFLRCSYVVVGLKLIRNCLELIEYIYIYTYPAYTRFFFSFFFLRFFFCLFLRFFFCLFLSSSDPLIQTALVMQFVFPSGFIIYTGFYVHGRYTHNRTKRKGFSRPSLL